MLNYYNYFTEIEETFVRRRAKNLFLSPIDWALMETWQERKIPLHVVIRGIEQVFDVFDKNPGPRTIKGLMFCREEVEAQYEEWSKANIGKSPETEQIKANEFSIGELAEHIDGLIAALRSVGESSIADDIDRACVRLDGLKKNLSANFEQIDKSFSDIEDLLDEALLTKLAKEKLAQAEKNIKAQLRPYRPSMKDEAFTSTFRLMLLKQLREELRIPRLSLFYL